MPATLSNNFKRAKLAGEIDFDAQTFKAILMQSGFVYSKDTHSNLSDVAASELAQGNGYTGAAAISGWTVSQDNANDKGIAAALSDPSWTASGGNIGPSPGAILYKHTGTASTSTVVGYIGFGADLIATAGQPFTIENITVEEA